MFYLQVMHLPWTTTYFKRWIFGAKLSDLAFYVIVPWYLFFQCVVNLWYWNPILFLNVSPKWALPGDASLQIFLHTHLPLLLFPFLKSISFSILKSWKFFSKMPLLDSPTEMAWFLWYFLCANYPYVFLPW